MLDVSISIDEELIVNQQINDKIMDHQTIISSEKYNDILGASFDAMLTELDVQNFQQLIVRMGAYQGFEFLKT